MAVVGLAGSALGTDAGLPPESIELSPEQVKALGEDASTEHNVLGALDAKAPGGAAASPSAFPLLLPPAGWWMTRRHPQRAYAMPPSGLVEIGNDRRVRRWKGTWKRVGSRPAWRLAGDPEILVEAPLQPGLSTVSLTLSRDEGHANLELEGTTLIEAEQLDEIAGVKVERDSDDPACQAARRCCATVAKRGLPAGFCPDSKELSSHAQCLTWLGGAGVYLELHGGRPAGCQ